jgi:hypothetical protein
MFVTRHSHLTDPVLSDRLWALYEAAYGPMAVESPSHEMLFRDEFDDALADATNRLWVLWDDTVPVAMALIATEIGPTRYLSRSFFEHRFPEHSRRGAVHYMMWLVVHPMYAAQGAIVRLARDGMQREAADGALLVFDCPEVHQPGVDGGFAEMMRRLANAFVGDVPVRHLGTSYYYAVDFAAVGTGDAPTAVVVPEHAGS